MSAIVPWLVLGALLLALALLYGRSQWGSGRDQERAERAEADDAEAEQARRDRGAPLRSGSGLWTRMRERALRDELRRDDPEAE